MLIDEKKIEEKGLEQVAALMCVAARSAPKAKGVDNIKTAIFEGEAKEIICKEMENIMNITNDNNFLRDANNLRQSPLVVLIGTKCVPLGLNCRMCRENCDAAKNGKVVCGFNLIDLGIAVGSAVSVAADLRVDNRIMFRVGIAARRLQLLGEEVKIILGIPLSVSGKNIFFDR